MGIQVETNHATIREKGIEALSKTLGPVGMARFLKEFSAGSGNYVRDRKRWLKGLKVKDIVKLARTKP